MKMIVEFCWDFATIPTTAGHQDQSMIIEMSLGNIIPFPTGTGGQVDSVNGKVGPVVLTAGDVGADVAGSAQAVREVLEPQIEANATGLNTKADAAATAQTLAGKANTAIINQQLSLKANQPDLDAAVLQLQSVIQSISNTATKQQYDFLVALLGTKADQEYVVQQIASLLNADAQTVAAIETIRDALNEDQGLLDALEYTVANRVRFDTPGQGLTALQKYNARNNISAEEAGTAALLIAQITTATLGAATAQQGTKADTAVQPNELAPVAKSGTFADLTGKSGIFGIVYTSFVVGANLALSTTDSLGTMLGKLQGQIDALFAALAGKEPKITAGAAGQYWDGAKTWQNLPTAANKPWVDLVVQAGSGHVSGFTDGTIKLQIAKENGYIWIQGVVRNTLGVSTNNLYANLPLAYMVKQPNQVTYVPTPATVINLNVGSQPIFLATYQSSPTVQMISKSNNGVFEANGVFFIAPAILGIAANP